MNQVRSDYELTMNRVIFNIKLRRATKPSHVLFDLSSLPCFFLTKEKVPRQGTIRVPPHKMKAVIAGFEKSSFLCSNAALTALLASLNESSKVLGLTILPTTYRQTHSLTGFERILSDTLSSAIRAIKQEWPQHTANSVRKALTLDVKKAYEITIRNVQEFDNSVTLCKLTYLPWSFFLLNGALFSIE